MLMIFLYILGALIFCLVLLLLVPFGVELQYSNDIKVKLRWLFFKFELYPQKEKKAMPEWIISLKKKVSALFRQLRRKLKGKKKKKTAPSVPKAEKTLWQQLSQERGFLGAIDFLRAIMSCVTGSLSKVASATDLKKLDIVVSVAGSEPDETARNCGYISAAVFPIASIICGSFKSSRKRIFIEPQFVCGETSVYIDLLAYVPLGSVLAGIIGELWSFIKSEIKLKTSQAVSAAMM